jgi:DnaK suppressor protein
MAGAMSPSDRERRRARAQLQARLDELRTKVSEEIVPEPAETFSGIAGEVQDVGDASVATEQTALRGALIERDVTELTAVGRALGRLDDGSYGRCVDCELEIDPARLEVLPTAARCSFCQELFERRAATIPAP